MIVVGYRMHREDAARIKAAAQHAGVSINQFVRVATLAAAEKVEKHYR